MTVRKQGKLLVVSAPSGTGKSTVCSRLQEVHHDVVVSISYTTRLPRGQERDGFAYHFVDDAIFDRMVAAGELLEWAEVHGKRYGSARADTEKLLLQGKDVVFDIDVQGGQQIKRSVPDALLVFLLPPSIKELVRRLKQRQTESPEQLKTRLDATRRELVLAAQYDYHVVNSILEDTLTVVDQIRKGRQPKSARCPELLDRLVQEAARLLG